MGISFILLSSLSFTLCTYFGKIVTNTTTMSGKINSFSRFLVGTIIMLAYMIYNKKEFRVPDIKPIFIRSFFSSLAVLTLYASIEYTTITNANMLNSASPMFVILLTPYFLKKPIKKTTYLYLAIIMAGSYVVANPSFKSINIGDPMAFISAFLAAVTVIYLKKAQVENENYTIIFYLMFLGLIMNIPFVYNDLVNFDMTGIIPVFMAGLFGTLGQVFLTMGYKYVDSATGSLVSTSRIVMGGLIGFIFLDEPINLRIIIGMILIIVPLVAISGYFSKDKTAS